MHLTSKLIALLSLSGTLVSALPFSPVPADDTGLEKRRNIVSYAADATGLEKRLDKYTYDADDTGLDKRGEW